MTTMFVTLAEAEVLAPQAALLLGLPASLWDDSTVATQEAALKASTAAIRANRYRWSGNESDGHLKLGTVVQALHLVDQQINSEAQARLQRQGVAEFGQGKQRVVFRGAQGTGPRGALALCLEAQEILRPLAFGAVSIT